MTLLNRLQKLDPIPSLSNNPLVPFYPGTGHENPFFTTGRHCAFAWCLRGLLHDIWRAGRGNLTVGQLPVAGFSSPTRPVTPMRRGDGNLAVIQEDSLCQSLSLRIAT